MKGTLLEEKSFGFCGCYYPAKKDNKAAAILMLGDSCRDHMAKAGAKWLNKKGIHALCIAPTLGKDYSHLNLPIERFFHAANYLKEAGNKKIAIIGGSTTAMEALVASSYCHDFGLTIAFSPSDFVMEGFIQDGLDGARERPGNGESSLSYEGKPLPYLPYAYRHPEYWQKIEAETKQSKNFLSSVQMFEESERLHPLQEEELIKVENIVGRLVCFGAEDDSLWDTAKYMRRMKSRLEEKGSKAKADFFIYPYGTHFCFPQSMLKLILPLFGTALPRLFASGRAHAKECKETRLDIEKQLNLIFGEWMEEERIEEY